MRVPMVLLAIVAATVQARAATDDDCSGGAPVVVSGSIDEVVTTDATSAEIILDRSTGACGVDAIRTEVVPGTCVKGRRVTGGGYCSHVARRHMDMARSQRRAV